MRLWPGREELVEGGKPRVQCLYCGANIDKRKFGQHQERSDHQGFRKLSYIAPVMREDNPQDELLRQNLEKLGDPGGATMGRFLQARDGFLLCYDEVKNITSFVYEIINPASVHVPDKRSSDTTGWQSDPLLPLNCILTRNEVMYSTPEDFNVGHITPWIYHQHDKQEQDSSRLVSNSCMQAKKLNNGPLCHVEAAGRHMSQKMKTHCITGTIILDDDPILIDDVENPTPIPDAIYKIHVFEINPTTFYYDAYYLPNSAEIDNDPELCRCSIETINLLSGFNFLSNKGVNFYTKTDQVNLPMLLANLTKEKDVAPLMNALKEKDEIIKAQKKELQTKDQEIQSLRFLLKQRDAQLKAPPAKKARKN